MGAPTLIVGIGGIGGNIIERLADRIKKEGVKDVELVVMDTDVNDLRRIRERNPRIYTVQTSPKGTVGKALDHNEYAREKWFPLNDGLTGKPFTEGAGQVRAVSRLAFDHAVEQGLMENLEKAIAKLHGLTGDSMRQEMRVIIVGSIAGGTGSGLVLPAAMYIRNFLISRYQDNSAIIRGFFLEPDVVFGRIVDEEERNTQRANAYAAVRELDAFFRKEYSGSGGEYSHIVFNAPQPGLGTRVDYPNILPYHFVFLMDAHNAEGDSLTDAEGRYDLEGYKQHAADCIYAQALSAVSARSNSSEDNVIRKLAANNGRSRYCGAGSSCLEYPMEDVRRYIALSWAKQAITGEWLEIDAEYQRRVREEPSLSLSRFYRTEYESRRGSNNAFYKTIMQNSVRKDRNGEQVDTAAQYLEDLEAHAKAWSQNELRAECIPLQRCLMNDNGAMKLRSLPANPDALIEQCSEDDDPTNTISHMFTSFFDNVKSYSAIAQEEVPDLSRASALSAFSISDYDRDPLSSRTKPWQLESVFCVAEGNESGSYHPAVVRYMLYRLEDLLKERLNDAREDADNAKSQMQQAERADYYGETEETEDVSSAVGLIFEEKGKKRRLPIPVLNKGAIGPEEADKLADIGNRLNKYKLAVDKFVENSVMVSFFESAMRYIANLSAAYEDFYNHMNRQIESIHSELDAIEHNPAYNDPKGRSHRYVCANTECLHTMKDICVMRGTSGDLPIELCGDIYKSLLRYAKGRARANDYGERNAMASGLFKILFREVVTDYWMNSVLDPHVGYPGIIDKSIVRAIADEALYTADSIFYDKEAENDYVHSYTLRAIEAANKLATPFIEPPVGEVPRNIQVCAFSEDAFEDAGASADDVSRVLVNSYNGTKVDSKEFSKYEILFYSSLYGFCATNLPKYAPSHKGLEMRPEGEYHRAYFANVTQLSPNLKDNKLITPHIDKHWHLVCALPDLNEENESRIQKDIVHSFLFGLLFQQFETEIVADGADVYYLKASAEGKKSSLWVSNGTPCDRFYEVFDALKFSPPVVNRLLNRSRRRLDAEKNGCLTLSLQNCQLIQRMRSKAFEDYDFEAWNKDIYELVSAFPGLPEGSAMPQPHCLADGKLNSSLATDLFGYGSPNDACRTSVFEIPLIYRISLPQSELREGEIDMMVESLFSVVEGHLANFCDEADLLSNCCQLFEEQYMLFEWNLIAYEHAFPNIHANLVVGVVREKVLSYLERSSVRHDRVNRAQNQFKDAWKKYRENR